MLAILWASFSLSILTVPILLPIKLMSSMDTLFLGPTSSSLQSLFRNSGFLYNFLLSSQNKNNVVTLTKTCRKTFPRCHKSLILLRFGHIFQRPNLVQVKLYI